MRMASQGNLGPEISIPEQIFVEIFGLGPKRLVKILIPRLNNHKIVPQKIWLCNKNYR